MAMIVDTRAILDLTSKGAAFVQQIASGWYKASEAMKLFPIRLAVLEHQSKNWESFLKLYGLRNHPSITPVLDQAIKLLEEEQLELTQLQQSCCSRMGRKLLFPESVIGALDNVIKAFQELPQMIRDQEDSRQALEELTLLQPMPLLLSPDSKYVPLEESIVKVREALESETSGPIVVISGGSGQGKTSMVRYLACLYQDGIYHPTESPEGQNLGPQICPPKYFGDGVFFLRCGKEANSKRLLLQLWQDLGYKYLPIATVQDPGNPRDEMCINMEPEDALQKKLSTRLATQELLVILDDIWDANIVEKVLVHQPRIKYLITTQIRRLWTDATCTEIQISQPTFQEANKILTNHVKGFPEEVSSDVQDQINTIIRKSDHNPLALANVATTIDNGAALEEWKNAHKYLLDLQHGDDKRPISLYGRTYSKRTMGASIEMALSVFPTEVQTLLFIAFACEGQPIPEIVFKILFKCRHSSLAKFFKCSQQLETSNFIRVERETNLGSAICKKSWIVHSMHQSFISLLKQQEIDLMFMQLLEQIDHDAQIVATLLVLYGQGKWCEEAKKKLGIPTNDRSSKLDSSPYLPIKPIVWLLHVDGEEHWEQRSHYLAKEILHQYLVSSELDEDNMSMLLTMPHTTSFGCETLAKMATFNERPLFNEKHQKILQALVNILSSTHDEGPHNHLIVVLKCLTHICLQNYENATYILSFPNALDSIVKLLIHKVSPITCQHVVEALGQLASSSVENRLLIGSLPQVIDRLVALLGEGVTPSVQENAAWTLGQLSHQVENAIKIGAYPGALERLVALLGEGVIPSIQHQAAWTLGQLSRQMVENTIKIEAYPGALERLVALLGEGVIPSVQHKVAWTLGQLSKQGVENAVKIGAYPGALERLVALLGEGVTPIVQEFAAWTLGQLPFQVVENAIKIGTYPGVLERLVALLGEGVTPNVQQKATWALGQLSRQGVQNAIKIGAYPGALEKLVALLGEGVIPSVQSEAAWTLGQLSGQMVENAIKIEAYPSVLERLVALLGEGVTPSVQEKGAWTLGQLSKQVVENAVKIGAYPSALEKLVALLGEGVTPNVQEKAAWTLGILSFQVVENAIKIGAYPGALEKLIALLGEGVIPSVQQEAIWTLGQLSRQMVENAIKIEAYPGALERLIALLGEGGIPTIQEYVAWTLGEFSKQVVENAVKIGAYPGALERIVALLGEGVTPSVQENAALTLGQLSQEVVKNAIKIGAYPGALERLVALLGEGVTPSVQEKAAWTLGQLSKQVVENAVKIGVYPSALERLVALLGGGVTPTVQEYSAWTLGQLSRQVVENAIKIGAYPGALERLATLLGEEVTPRTQKDAALTLGFLSQKVVENAIKIGIYPGALERLVALLGVGRGCLLQLCGAQALCNMCCGVVENQGLLRTALLENPSARKDLMIFLSGDPYEDGSLQYWGALVYTMANIENENNQARFKSSRAYQGKGDGKLTKGDYKGALEAYDDGLAIEVKNGKLLSNRCFVKAKLEDFEGALEDANKYIEIGNNKPFGLQERGVLKRLMGDLNGALVDLNEGLELEANDYESLKHRGLVKFLLKDEDGARADAEWALRVKAPRVDNYDYGRNPCLGTSSVEFLCYKLK